MADTTVDTTSVTMSEDVRRVVEYDKSQTIKVPLDEDQEQQIIDMITDEMGAIQRERDAMNFDELVTHRQAYYDGNKDLIDAPDGPFGEASAKFFYYFASQICDILTIKAVRQTITPTPIITMVPEEDGKTESLRDREDALDWHLRHDDGINIEALIKSVYREAAIQGTSIVKVAMTTDVEYPVYRETYQPTDDDIRRYQADYAEQLASGEQAYVDNLEKLRAGDVISVVVQDMYIKYRGPRPYRVPIRQFFARPSIPDLSRQRWIAEQRTLTWADIHDRLVTGYYDQDAIDKLQQKAGDKWAAEHYDVYEGILYADLSGGDKPYRYLITYEAKYNVILRAIYYPYRGNKIMYIPYYIKRRDDNLYGYALMDRLIDANQSINAAINASFDALALRNAPPVMVPDEETAKQFESRIWGPLSVFINKSDKNPITPLPLGAGGVTDSLQVANIIQRFGEMNVGISATYLSGRESPLDPNAPAAKAALLMRESNTVIEDSIFELQRSNAQLAELCESLIVQYSQADTIAYWQGATRKIVNKALYSRRVRYLPSGLSISVDRFADLQTLVGFLGVVGKVAPPLFQDPEWLLKMLELYIDNAGGSLERNKEPVLRPLREAIKMRNKSQAGQGMLPDGGQQQPMNPAVDQIKRDAVRVLQDPSLSNEEKQQILKQYEQKLLSLTGDVPVQDTRNVPAALVEEEDK
jgi:hypothetical protein